MMSSLVVSCSGLRWTLVGDTAEAGGTIFGRGAEIDIDSNPFLHRQVGRFVLADGYWWIENLSAWTTLRLVADGTSAVLPSNGRAPLLHAETFACFQAGPCNYELLAHLDEVPSLPPPSTGHDDRTATYRPTTLPLTTDQRLMVAALAERRLIDPADRTRLPTNQAVARRLGWSLAKFNRKLDYLCLRLSRLGVSVMRETGRRALERREHLVAHLLASRQITLDDLDALRTHDESAATS